MLAVTDLHAFYGRAHILQGVSLEAKVTNGSWTTVATIDPADDGTHLVAKIAEEPQGIRGIIGDARDQASDQKLACDHASVEFIHRARRSCSMLRDLCREHKTRLRPSWR